MGGKGRFKFLEHMGDALVEAYGDTLKEAFENIALAMFEIMTDPSKVKPLIEHKIEIEAKDEKELLYSWLEELLVKFEIDNVLFSFFKVEGIKKTSKGYKLRAKIKGEPLDLKKHPSKVGIKAVTYHMMEVEKTDGIRLRVLFDL